MAKKPNEILLVTAQGKDTPGITAKLTDVIANDEKAKILDIEQTVVHKKLILSILVGFPGKNGDKTPLLKNLLFAASKLKIQLNFEVFEPEFFGEEESQHQYVITCLGEEIGALALSQITKALAKRGFNIDKIGKLTLKNISAIELTAHARKKLDAKKLTQELLGLSTYIGVDIAIQPLDLLRRTKRLVVMDMDSTLIQNEVIDEMARQRGIFHKVAKITEAAMNGKLNFYQSLQKRLFLLRGMTESELNLVYKKLKLTPGADKLLKVLNRMGYKVGLISGGFTYFTDRLQKRLGFNFVFANELEWKNGKITGKIKGQIVDANRKAAILETIARAEGISLDQTIAIGDGANDIKMLTKAGLGIAFNAKPAVKEKTHYSISRHRRIDSILYLLGISEKEIQNLSRP